MEKAVNVIITNPSDKSFKATKGILSQIMVDSKMSAADKVTFLGGVAVNESKKKATDAWGKLSEVQSEGEGDLYIWKQETGETCVITADKETKQIIKIVMKTVN